MGGEKGRGKGGEREIGHVRWGMLVERINQRYGGRWIWELRRG